MNEIIVNIKTERIEGILNGTITSVPLQDFKEEYEGWVYISDGQKVVARFYCDKVQVEICNTNDFYDYSIDDVTLHEAGYRVYEEFEQEFHPYDVGFLHITKLEVFDEPKELKINYSVVKGKTTYEYQ